jgi:hypothetical protein
MNELRGLRYTLATGCLVVIAQAGHLLFVADETHERVISSVLLILGLGVIATALIQLKRRK